MCVSLLLAGCHSDTLQQQEISAEIVTVERHEKYAIDDYSSPDAYISGYIYPWQEAYVALLRDYMRYPFDEWHTGWRFILHDFDRNGIPELLIFGNQGVTSDIIAAYAFVNDEVLPLEIDRPIWLSFYAMPRNNQSGMIALWFSDGLFSYTDYKDASSNGWDLIILDEGRLVTAITTTVMYFVSHCREEYGVHHYIDGTKIAEAEFTRITESILGNWDDGFPQLGSWPVDITETYIQEQVFGWKSALTWQEAYAELLRNYIPSAFDEFMGWRFILYDFDLDGIPELLILGNQGWRSESVAAYTFVDGKVLPLEIDRVTWSSFYTVSLDDRQGVIGASFSENLEDYMHYDNVAAVSSWNLITLDECVLITETIASAVTLASVNWEERVIHHYIGGTKVTEAEFTQATQSLFGKWEYGIHRLSILPDNVTETAIQERIFGWNSAPLTWQEAYAVLLQEYSELPIDWTWDDGLYFALHNINEDGIPELFIVMKNVSGHVRNHVYTFAEGAVIPLELDGNAELFGSLFMLPDRYGFTLYWAVGSGGGYTQLVLNNNALVIANKGIYHLNEAGWAREGEENWASQHLWQDKYYDIFLNGDLVTITEFESIFGNWHEKEWLEPLEISAKNIQLMLFGFPEFTGFEGVIREIQALADDILLVLVENYPISEDRINFTVDQNSLVVSAVEIEVGKSVHVFYETIQRYLSSQYPPHVRAKTLVLPYIINSYGHTQLVSGAGSFLGRFDENWNYSDITHAWYSRAWLDISDSIEILLQDGSLFEGELNELAGRALLVFFSSAIRYTFPQVLPTRIYVLSET